MVVLRRLLVLAVVATAAGALAQPSFARPSLSLSLGSTHFLVHYQSDTTDDSTKSWAITQTQAGDIAALAEAAYTKELADGFAAPLSDGTLGGDSRLDIYVEDLGADGAASETWADGTSPTSGYFELNGDTPTVSFTQAALAVGVFHLFQIGVWLPASTSDYWLLEASAEWMGHRVDGYAGTSPELAGSDVSLDCQDPVYTNECDPTNAYLNAGFGKWPFFEYLGERYGPSFVKDVLARGAAGAGSATQALAAALAVRGTTLAATFDNWSVVDMESLYTPTLLQGRNPTPYTTVQTGDKAGTVASTSVAVDHLATRYVEFDRGTGDPSAPCSEATLTIKVTIPAGTQSEPVFWWKADGTTSTPLPLTAGAGGASITVPWDTCTWSKAAGFLALPNASTNVDAAAFGVNATMTVDTTKPGSATTPPAPVSVNTPVVPVTSTENAPVLDAFGPELLTVGPGESTIRLIVQANDQGSIAATLGSVSLGTVAIRPGANDVRFRLPVTVLSSLRRSAATNTLVLTPVSWQGHVLGAPVLRRVSVAAARAAAKKRSAKKTTGRG